MNALELREHIEDELLGIGSYIGDSDKRHLPDTATILGAFAPVILGVLGGLLTSYGYEWVKVPLSKAGLLPKLELDNQIAEVCERLRSIEIDVEISLEPVRQTAVNELRKLNIPEDKIQQVSDAIIGQIRRIQ